VKAGGNPACLEGGLPQSPAPMPQFASQTCAAAGACRRLAVLGLLLLAGLRPASRRRQSLRPRVQPSPAAATCSRPNRDREVVPADPGPGPVRGSSGRRLEAGDDVHYTIRVPIRPEPGDDAQVRSACRSGCTIGRSATGPACDIEFSTDGGGRSPPNRRTGLHARALDDAPAAPAQSTTLLRFRATFR